MLKRGDVREDGYIFLKYGKVLKNGKREERWLSPESWEREKLGNGLLRRLKNYELSVAEFDERMKAQNNSCNICSTLFSTDPESLRHIHVDHDHATGKVRSLLCIFCNHMLGNARDKPEVLERGAQYLRDYRDNDEAPRQIQSQTRLRFSRKGG